MLSFSEWLNELHIMAPTADQEQMMTAPRDKLLPPDFKFKPKKFKKAVKDVAGGKVKDGTFLPKRTLGVPRIEMPQLKSREEFLRWVISLGIPVNKVMMRPSELVKSNGQKHTGFAQSQIYVDKALRMIRRNVLLDKLIIVTRENIIFDGNHHWLALMTAVEAGKIKNDPVPMYKVDYPFEDLRRITAHFPGVSYEK